MADNTSIRKNMIWNVLGSMAFVGAQWMMTILVVRLSGYDAAGWLSLGLSLTNISTNIVYFGIRNFQVSDTEQKYSDLTYIYQRLALAFGSVLIYTVFVLLNGYESKKAVFLILFMVYRLSEPLADVFHGIDQKRWRLDIAGISYLMRGFPGLLVFVAVLKLTGNLIVTTIAMIAVVYPVLLLYDVPKALGFIDGKDVSSAGGVITTSGDNKKLLLKNIVLYKEGILKLTFECFPLFVYAICLNSVVPIPRYFLERIAGSEVLGFYASAAIPASIIQMLSSYVYTTFTGLFSQYASEGKKREFVRLLCLLCLCIIMLGLCACGACLIPADLMPGGKGLGLGDWGLRLLFTGSIGPYTYLLVPTIMSCIVIALVWFMGMLLTVLRDRAGLIAGAVTGVVVSLAASRIIMGRLGVDGINPTIAISSAATLIIFAFRVAERVIGISGFEDPK